MKPGHAMPNSPAPAPLRWLSATVALVPDATRPGESYRVVTLPDGGATCDCEAARDGSPCCHIREALAIPPAAPAAAPRECPHCGMDPRAALHEAFCDFS